MKETDLVGVGQPDGISPEYTLAELREALAHFGLHVITAAEKLVLEAAGSVPERVLETWCGHVSDWPRRIARAELARREAK